VSVVQEKLDKMSSNESKLAKDIRQLRQALDEAENQLTKAELLRRAMDGDNERLKMALADKDTETQACSTVLGYIVLFWIPKYNMV